MPLLVCCFLCYSPKGGLHGLPDPPCPVHVSFASFVSLYTPSPRARLCRPPSTMSVSDSLCAFGLPPLGRVDLPVLSSPRRLGPGIIPSPGSPCVSIEPYALLRGFP
jgi:hypothetical protein